MGKITSVIINLEGGLGNQLYQYAAGLSFSKKYLVPLKVVEREDSPNDPRRHSHLGLFNCNYKAITGFEKLFFKSLFIRRFSLGKYARKFLPYFYPFTIISDPESGFFPDILEGKKGRIFLRGYWQSFKYFESIREELLEVFRLKFPPQDPENLHFLNLIQNTESVALHIRRGDYVQIPFFLDNFGLCSLDYYKKAMNHMSLNLNSPQFFIFSDDPDWVQENLDLGKNMHFIRHNLMKHDYEDFRLLKSCKHFIIANSSFSWWAAWLGEYPLKIVLSPARWFNKDTMPIQDRIPENWITIK